MKNLVNKLLPLSTAALILSASWSVGTVYAGIDQLKAQPPICAAGFKSTPMDAKGQYTCYSEALKCSANLSVIIPKYNQALNRFDYACAFPVGDQPGGGFQRFKLK